MPNERESPSAGWEEVYAAMDADTSIEPAERPCPACGRLADRVIDAVYVCEDHGAWRATADD